MSKTWQTESKVNLPQGPAITLSGPPLKGPIDTTSDTGREVASNPPPSNSPTLIVAISAAPVGRRPPLSTSGPLEAPMGPGTDATEYSGSEVTTSDLKIPEATPTTEAGENQGASSSPSKLVAQQPPKESVWGNHTGQSNSVPFQGYAVGGEAWKPTGDYFQPKEYLF
ncbi:hypothetical protein BD410DRAFT_845210 [Rickenella mellea]|uniref:Uncharacterized protein n=1 Tax=Rickenella mellea TaxID=50990 RepID=A0A4Y7PK85_9AGAM|nr:hypothetical protein BD410DRAFT_845210 [Rickenella mellea]